MSLHLIFLAFTSYRRPHALRSPTRRGVQRSTYVLALARMSSIECPGRFAQTPLCYLARPRNSFAPSASSFLLSNPGSFSPLTASSFSLSQLLLPSKLSLQVKHPVIGDRPRNLLSFGARLTTLRPCHREPSFSRQQQSFSKFNSSSSPSAFTSRQPLSSLLGVPNIDPLVPSVYELSNSR